MPLNSLYECMIWRLGYQSDSNHKKPSNTLITFNVNLGKKKLFEKFKKNLPTVIKYQQYHTRSFIVLNIFKSIIQREPAVCNCSYLSFTVTVKTSAHIKRVTLSCGFTVCKLPGYHTGLKQRGWTFPFLSIQKEIQRDGERMPNILQCNQKCASKQCPLT